jgi:nitrite reductase (cytochrome c-552)
MNPDSILNYFNNLMFDDKPFADYTNPRSGVRQIKVQHPEFETFLGAGSEHGAGNDADSKIFACADCHMGTAVNAAGATYIDHEWTSPLKNAALIANTCIECHDDVAADVKEIQTAVKGKTKEVGLELEDLMEKLVVAAESKQYSDEQLDAIRAVFRNAQFYWDFVFVENSNGAHNPTLTEQCLDKAAGLAAEVRTMIEQL